MRLWYLRRAVPWAALLGCLAGAAVMSAMTHHWPAMGWLGMPCVALLCAAAAGLVRDEAAAAVVAVTPRGDGWAATVRSAAALLPLVASLVLLLTMPAELHLDSVGVTVLGVATVLLTVGSATLAAAHQRPRPGGTVASAAVLLGLAPLPVAALLDTDPLFPLGAFPQGITAFWLLAGALGLVAWLAPRLRRRRAPARRPVRRRPARRCGCPRRCARARRPRPPGGSG